MPKEHYANLFELPEETAGEAMKVAKKMADKMMKRLGCEGLNVVQNNGEMAGQTVFHFHMHLIPRYRTASDGSRRRLARKNLGRFMNRFASKIFIGVSDRRKDKKDGCGQ